MFSTTNPEIPNNILGTFDEFTLRYTTDLSVSTESVDLTPKEGGPWGVLPWGSGAWGGVNQRLQSIPTYVPKEKAICHWINLTAFIEQALKQFSLCGLSFFYVDISPRSK